MQSIDEGHENDRKLHQAKQIETSLIAQLGRGDWDEMIRHLEAITAKRSDFRWMGKSRDHLCYRSAAVNLNLKPISEGQVYEGRAMFSLAPDRIMSPSRTRPKAETLLIHPVMVEEDLLRWRIEPGEGANLSAEMLRVFSANELAESLAQHLVEYSNKLG
jgi:hypothetical protein